MAALLGLKEVTNAVIKPPIPPIISHGITAAEAASGLVTAAWKNLFQVKIAAAITSKSMIAVLFIVPFMVITSADDL